MEKHFLKEEQKTKRTIITGVFKVVAAVLAAIITAVATILAVIIKVKNNPSPIPPSNSSEVSNITESLPQSGNFDVLCDTAVLYDGESYREYKYSSDTFSLGSHRYNCGFTITSPNPNKESSSPNGFVLMDLDKNYSAVKFSVGRVKGDSNSSATLVVYLDNKFVQEYTLQGKTSYIDIDINSLNSKNLRLELIAEKDSVYGFSNVLLHK